MNFKQYIILMIIASVLAWLTWGFLIIGISPEEANIGAFFLFYVSLLIAMSGTLSILGLVLRAWVLKRDEIISRQASKSFRQAALFSVLFTGILYLQSKNLLNWWIIVLFICTLSMIEFFLISYKSRAFDK